WRRWTGFSLKASEKRTALRLNYAEIVRRLRDLLLTYSEWADHVNRAYQELSKNKPDEAGRARAASRRQLADDSKPLSGGFQSTRKAEHQDAIPSLIILVDEMDKITDPKERQNAINHLKDLFRIPFVKFVTTVAEDNYQRFRFRSYGLPGFERDPYDSAFDEIIELQPLQSAESVQLFTRRVVGFPAPLGLLAYCLTNGHPRDMIRLAREALDAFAKAVGVEPDAKQVGLSKVEEEQRLTQIRSQRRQGLQQAIETICHQQKTEFVDLLDVWERQQRTAESAPAAGKGDSSAIQQWRARRRHTAHHRLTATRRSDFQQRMDTAIDGIRDFVVSYADDPAKGWAEPAVNSDDCVRAEELAERRQLIKAEIQTDH
ncbi:MAG: hypothetical protein LBL92_03870, partial [Propionibacteriaceae bacterium]|nr:hypothetical protein [Propionibacteriaceae bacterium]